MRLLKREGLAAMVQARLLLFWFVLACSMADVAFGRARIYVIKTFEKKCEQNQVDPLAEVPTDSELQEE